MDAILVETAKGMRKWHWLNERDPGRTLCGRARLELAVISETSALVELPPVEACQGCAKNATGWSKPPVRSADGVYSESRPGRLRTAGPLAHGSRSHRGRRV